MWRQIWKTKVKNRDVGVEKWCLLQVVEGGIECFCWCWCWCWVEESWWSLKILWEQMGQWGIWRGGVCWFCWRVWERSWNGYGGDFGERGWRKWKGEWGEVGVGWEDEEKKPFWRLCVTSQPLIFVGFGDSYYWFFVFCFFLIFFL